MRTVYVDLSSDICIKPIFAGYEGEHNATQLTVKIPNRMIINNVDYYTFCFELPTGECIESDGYAFQYLNNGELSLYLPKQIMVRGDIIVAINAYCVTTDESTSETTVNLLEKTSEIRLFIENSPNGRYTKYDDRELSNIVWEFVNIQSVLYNEKQNLTDEQKKTARDNIGAAGIYVGSGDMDEESLEDYDIWVDTNEDCPQSDLNIPTTSEYFDIDDNGIVSLKSEFRGYSVDDTYHLSVSDKGVGFIGSKAFCLPSKIIIPETINGMTVTGLVEGMFAYNNFVEEIVIPSTVTSIPAGFCYHAHQLKLVANTEHIENIAYNAFRSTRIEEAIFPNLKTMGDSAFNHNVFLHTVNIGKVTEIPKGAFAYCRSLKTVCGGDDVKTIHGGAFFHTTALKTVSFLNKLNVTEIKDAAFIVSNVRFDWSVLTHCTFGTYATPVSDNKIDFWSSINYSDYACENRLGTLLNQSDTRWKDISFERANKTWSNCCGVFSTLHIHSALSGNSYNTPMEYETKLLAAVDAAKKEAQTDEEKQAIEDALSVESSYESEIIYNVLGYEAQRICSGDTCIDSVIFKTMLSALKDGAYAHLSISSLNDSDNDGVLEGYPNGGHAVIAYGVTENGEIMIADSASGSASVGASNEMLTYQIPLQNIMGEQGDIVIVKNK